MILNINHQPINEVYIGKTPELIAIEKQLDVFRNKIHERFIYQG